MSETDEIPDVSAAVNKIWVEFEDRYPSWNRFAFGAEAHAEANGYDIDWLEPEAHFPVVRYRMTPDDLRQQPEITDAHLDHLVEYVRDGMPSRREVKE